MDIFSFINSKDIADYLKKIGYGFSPKEQAWIVWHSQKKTLNEKVAAWREIGVNNPDYPVSYGKEKEEPLANLLNRYIELIERELQAFYAASDEVFYEVKCCHKEEGWDEDYSVQKSAQACFDEVKWAHDGHLEWLKKMEIKQTKFGKRFSCREVLFNAAFEPMRIEVYGEYSTDDDLEQLFENMWFAFPTPFKKGDIVVSRHHPYGGYRDMEEPFVLTNLISWGSKDLKANGYEDKDGLYKRVDEGIERRTCSRYASTMDMTAYGYFQQDDGRLYHECIHDYFDLEYYRGKPTGLRKILWALSNYLKDEIEVDLLMNAYSVILQEDEAQRTRDCLNFRHDAFVLAGLEEPFENNE